ncbi:MAG: ribosome assembly cofactor RimP [Bacteroidota bacterium]
MKIIEKRGLRSPLLFGLNEMITIDKIKKLAEEKIAEGADFIVDISVKPGNKITVLLDNDNGVSIGDCVAMSRHIEFNLDRETDDFELNVMSPGLTEPFKTLRQYQKYLDKQVDVTTKENKKLTGKLLSVNNEGIELETKVKEKTEGKKAKQLIISNISLTFNQIKETKVVISF